MKLTPPMSMCLVCSLSSALLSQNLTVVNSWLGNSGGTPQSHIMHNVANMFVRADGTAYAITGWEEGGHNVSVFKNGAQIAIPEASGTGGWGRMSGGAVTADNDYIYQVLTQHGCDGGNTNLNDNGLPQYPPCDGDNQPLWCCIARYDQSGTLAPFSQGYGFRGAYLLVNTDGEVPNGVAVYNNELFVADPSDDMIRVHSTTNLTTVPVRTFHVSRVGLLSPDDQGCLWMLQPEDLSNDARIVRFSTVDGTMQSQEITFATGVVPTALCVDTERSRILVTDIGENQNIRIYGTIYDTPSLTGTFGTQNGILSGVPGQAGAQKFVNPMGVGVDSVGNIYVASTGFAPGASTGTTVEGYSLSGALDWSLQGLVFTGCADADHASPENVYTFDRHFTMDYSRTQPGSEWTYTGHTVNKFKYPEDARLTSIFFTSALVRTINGHRILYTSDMYGSCLGVYRFDSSTDGEIAIPCGFFTSGSWGDGWPNGHPLDKEFFWLDLNNDGGFQANEFDAVNPDNIYSMAWWVDSAGGVWKGVRQQGVRYFPVQGLDANGAPVYSYATSIKYPLPEGTNGVKRICYDAARDELFLAGFSATAPDTGDTWWCMGSTICKYSAWLSSGNRTPTWTLYLPFTATGDQSLDAKAFCVEGDYLFVAGARNGLITVYRTDDKSLVGTIEPGTSTDESSGWTDIDIAITATQRSNGEYLVFMEENGNGKVMMYRWCPTGNCVQTSIVNGAVLRSLPGTSRSPILGGGANGRMPLYRLDGTRTDLCAARLCPGVYFAQRHGQMAAIVSHR